jgi:hypothetical protein
MGAFKFCDKSNSYCNEKGLKGNNGVIGVKIFTEKQYLPIYINQFNKYDNIYIPHPPVDPIPSPQYPRDIPMISDVPYNGSNFDKTVTCSSYTSHACTNNTPDFNVGTTWGQKLNESTVEVSFEPDYVDSEMVIYYASKKSLQKLGINFDNKIKKIYKPKAFPQYAIPPKNWNG